MCYTMPDWHMRLSVAFACGDMMCTSNGNQTLAMLGCITGVTLHPGWDCFLHILAREVCSNMDMVASVFLARALYDLQRIMYPTEHIMYMDTGC